jgi:preprotein translocase subunit SecF
MNWLKYKKIYFSVSALMIAVGLFGLINWGLKLGVDFTGGTIVEYSFETEISTEEITGKIQEQGFEVSSIQSTGENQYIFRLAPVSSEDKEKLKDIVLASSGGAGVEELRFETVGPSVGPELIKKTIYAITIAGGAILLWIAYQFRSLKFGASAVAAMFHDTFILVGMFALFGKLFNAEIDFLFVTAVLTTLSFSVHDTIVVYDRIRETQKNMSGDLNQVANMALTETMVRSLNNSFTIVFMLMALILLGGTTVKWFAVALFVGTILGTYSSPFVAVPLLTIWDDLGKILNRKKK